MHHIAWSSKLGYMENTIPAIQNLRQQSRPGYIASPSPTYQHSARGRHAEYTTQTHKAARGSCWPEFSRKMDGWMGCVVGGLLCRAENRDVGGWVRGREGGREGGWRGVGL